MKGDSSFVKHNRQTTLLSEVHSTTTTTSGHLPRRSTCSISSVLAAIPAPSMV